MDSNSQKTYEDLQSRLVCDSAGEIRSSLNLVDSVACGV